MGEAKRREKLDPDFGKPAIYSLNLYQHEEPVASIRFASTKLPQQYDTDRRAVSVAGLIFCYLTDPTPSNRKHVESVTQAEGLDDLAVEVDDTFTAEVVDDSNQEKLIVFARNQDLLPEDTKNPTFTNPETIAAIARRL